MQAVFKKREMKTIVICGYSGVGKTTFCQRQPFSIDIDSAEIPKYEKFVKEYLKRITACIGRYRYICVSTHAVLIDALADMKLSVVLVYPDLKLKREYIRRYLARGNSYAYAKNIESTWHINLETLKHEVRFPAIVLSSGEYLLDWLPYLERIT